MTTSAEVVRRKYASHLYSFTEYTPRATITLSLGYLPRDVALFALQVALEDLEEVWQDEYASVVRKLENMGRCLADKINELEQAQLRCDALEAECLRLRKKNGSSSATFAETGLPEPAASSTSKPLDRMHPLPVESSSGSGGGGERVLSARTLKRRQIQQEQKQEVGDSAAGDPFDWPGALDGVLSREQIGDLAAGKTKWFEMSKVLQRRVVMRIAETIHHRLGDISQSLYTEYKPAWATGHGSWSKTCDLTWREVLVHLDVKPSMLRKATRIGRSAMR